MHKARRYNLDHYKAPASRPVFLTTAPRIVTKPNWRAISTGFFAGFAIAAAAAFLLIHL